MSSDEEELRRLLVELRFLEGAAESIQSRINFINAALMELNIANRTLEGIRKEKENTQLLIPIGGGSYIKARLESSEKMIYGVGAGVAIEKTIEEAREGISNRIAELDRTKRSLESQLSQLLRRIEEDRSRLQELTAKINRGVKASDVRKAQRRAQ